MGIYGDIGVIFLVKSWEHKLNCSADLITILLLCFVRGARNESIIDIMRGYYHDHGILALGQVDEGEKDLIKRNCWDPIRRCLQWYEEEMGLARPALVIHLIRAESSECRAQFLAVTFTVNCKEPSSLYVSWGYAVVGDHDVGPSHSPRCGYLWDHKDSSMYPPVIWNFGSHYKEMFIYRQKFSGEQVVQ